MVGTVLNSVIKTLPSGYSNSFDLPGKGGPPLQEDDGDRSRALRVVRVRTPIPLRVGGRGNRGSARLQVDPGRPFSGPATRYMLSISGTFGSYGGFVDSPNRPKETWRSAKPFGERRLCMPLRHFRPAGTLCRLSDPKPCGNRTRKAPVRCATIPNTPPDWDSRNALRGDDPTS